MMYLLTQIQSLARDYYPDIAHEPVELMQRFQYEIDIDSIPPWSNPYQVIASLFKGENQNMLINDVKIAENTIHKRLYVLILARPKKEDEIYREQLNHLLYE